MSEVWYLLQVRVSPLRYSSQPSSKLEERVFENEPLLQSRLGKLLSNQASEDFRDFLEIGFIQDFLEKEIKNTREEREVYMELKKFSAGPNEKFWQTLNFFWTETGFQFTIIEKEKEISSGNNYLSGCQRGRYGI